MSGSPKRSQAEIEAERLRLLEEERKKQERLNAIARASAAREYEATRLRAASIDLQTALSAIHASLPQARRVVDASRFRRYEERHRELIVRADRTAGFEALSALEAEVRSLEAELVGRINRGAVAATHETGQRVSAEADVATDTAEVQALLEIEQAKGGPRFDPAGNASVTEQLEAVRRASALGHSREARNHVAAARREYRKHAETVARLKANEDAELHKRRAECERLRGRIAAGQSDPLVLRWSSGIMQQAQQALSKADDALQRRDTVSLARAVLDADTLLTKAITTAESEESKETGRKYIVASIVDVLSKRFNCDTPRLVGGPSDGSVVIRARKPSQAGPSESVEVHVARDGSLQYIVDGYKHRTSPGSHGEEYTSCDEAEQEILALHHELRRNHQIRPAPLRWDGQHPSKQPQSERQEAEEPGKRRRNSSAKRQAPQDV